MTCFLNKACKHNGICLSLQSCVPLVLCVKDVLYIRQELCNILFDCFRFADAASQAGDADSSRVPGLTSGLQGSVNVQRGALFLVQQ